MTKPDRVPTTAIQGVAKGHEGEVLDAACSVTARRTTAQIAQLVEVAMASERDLLPTMAASSGAGR